MIWYQWFKTTNAYAASESFDWKFETGQTGEVG